MADPLNNNVMKGLAGKIYDMVTAPDTVNSGVAAAPTFIQFAAPGIAISPADLDFGDLTDRDEIRANSDFSQLVNSVPGTSGSWVPTNSKTWDIYNRAITNIDLPASSLTEEEQTMLQRAQDYLVEEKKDTDPFTGEETTTTQPSRYAQAYSSLFGQYQAKLLAFNGRQIQANSRSATPEQVQDFNINGPVYRQAVIDAYADWGSRGNRDRVQQAQGIISNLTGKGPEARYQTLRALFAQNQRLDPATQAAYYPTFYFPRNVLSSEAFDDSWMTISYSMEDISEFENKSSSSWGAGGGARWGLWKASGSAQYSREQSESQADTENMSLKVDLLQVPLMRPWWDGSVFQSRGWRWTKSAGQEPISNGSTPPGGQMPVIPVSMLLARNLDVKTDMSSENNKAASSSLKTSASVGWGPFSVKGNYASSRSSSAHQYTESSDGIQVSGPQIIGFICEVLSKSPNPDPSLDWPADS